MSRAGSLANRNKNNSYERDSGKAEEFDISQSHPDLAPARQKRAPHLRFQNKSMSSGQLMAMAAKYATIAGDRIHPSSLLRSLPNDDDGQNECDKTATEGENANFKPPPSSPNDFSSQKSDAVPLESSLVYNNESEDRTLLNSL